MRKQNGSLEGTVEVLPVTARLGVRPKSKALNLLAQTACTEAF